MKAYSNDFRTKIVDTNWKALESIQQTADRFSVSYSFVWKLLNRYGEMGSVEPKPHGGGAKAKLNTQQLAVVAELVEEDNDAILVELCDRLEQRVGIRISRATMGRIVQKLELTRKKNSTCD